MNLTHLRNRTEHSYQYAAGKIEVVLQQQKTKSAGIVDRSGTWGHVRWAGACKKAGIKPIFGVELAVVGDMEEREKQAPNFMTFLAANDKGLQELYELVTLATEKFYYFPRIDYPIVETVCSGGNVIVLSGNQPNWEYIGEDWNNFYIEVNPLSHPAIRSLAQANGDYPLIATQDNLYPRPTDKNMYQIVMGDRGNMRTAPGHILDIWEWKEQCEKNGKDYTDAIENAFEVADACNAKLPSAVMVSPKVTKTMEQQCAEGAKALGCNLKDPVYKARLKRELDLIKEKKFEDYFYVVADMINYAKTIMFVGPARGSSCGSLVCWLMGITDIDPIPYDLLFERFIDINREDYPDIDIDFQDDKRELVFEYIRKKYGHENVARLGTINVFKAKSAISLVSKQLQVPMWEVKDLKDSIMERSSGDARAALCILDTFNDLEIGRTTLAKYPELALAAELEGHASHTGQHAAGIIITAEPISNYCSVNAKDAANICMLDKYDAEKLNLLKIDALGLRTLSVLQDTLDQIGKSREWLKNFPTNDKKAFGVLNQAKFSGIFQFEGYALQSLTRQLNVEGIEDIVSITALARPGPLNSGGANEFIKRRMGTNPVTYLHALAEEITKVTYGVIVYQEQVMQISRIVGGLSWEDVSQLRKAMSKSLGKEFFDKYFQAFRKGAAKHNITEEQAQVIWDNINTMGSWAFNRSHAVAYGLLSYWCCVLKAHYPLEFSAACLRNAKDDEQSIKILRELVKEGYSYTAIDKDLSEANWSVKNGRLIGGLMGIKGVGAKLAESLVRKRETGAAFTPREIKLMTEGVTPWDSVFETRDLWQHIKDSPEAYGIESRIVNLEEIGLDSRGMFVFIAKVKEKDLRDHNELQFLQKRGGKKMEGQTNYLNLTLEDDTGSILASINKYRYEQHGMPIVENDKIGDWYIFKGENKPGFRKIHIHRYRKLTDNPDFVKKSPVKCEKVVAETTEIGDNDER